MLSTYDVSALQLVPIGNEAVARWFTGWQHYADMHFPKGDLGEQNNVIYQLECVYHRWLKHWQAQGEQKVDFMSTMATSGVRRLASEYGMEFRYQDGVMLIASLPGYVEERYGHYNNMGIYAEPECVCGLVERCARAHRMG